MLPGARDDNGLTRREAFRFAVLQFREYLLEELARELEAQKAAMDLIVEGTEVDKWICDPDSMLQEDKRWNVGGVLEGTGKLGTNAGSFEIERGHLGGVAGGNPIDHRAGSFTEPGHERGSSGVGVLEEEPTSKREEGATESGSHSIDFISNQLKLQAIHDGALSVEAPPTTGKAILLSSVPMTIEIGERLIPSNETVPMAIQPMEKLLASVETGQLGQRSDDDSVRPEHQFNSDDRVESEENCENLAKAQVDVSRKENGFVADEGENLEFSVETEVDLFPKVNGNLIDGDKNSENSVETEVDVSLKENKTRIDKVESNGCKEEDEAEESDSTLGESSEIDDSSENLSGEKSSETSSDDEEIIYSGRDIEAGEIRDGLVQSVVEEIVQRKKGKNQQRNEDFESGSDEENIKEPICTKHEINVLPQVPPINVKLNASHNPLPVGVISSVLGTYLVVEGIEGQQALNEGSILWITEKRLPLGLVDEIFGPVKKPYYVVRYNDNNEVPEEAKEGIPVSFVPEFATFVLNDPSLYKKGYDASGEHDEELSEAEVEFSDDEKEAEFKRAKAKMKRGNQEKEPHQEKEHHESAKQDYVSGDKGKRWRGVRGREWDNRCLSQENRRMDLDQDYVSSQEPPRQSRLAESVANTCFRHGSTQEAVAGVGPRKQVVLQQQRPVFNVQPSHSRQNYKKTWQRNQAQSQQAHGVAKGNNKNDPRPPNLAGLFSHPTVPGPVSSMGLMEVHAAQQFSFPQPPVDVGTAHLQWHAGQRTLGSPTMHPGQTTIGIGVAPAPSAAMHLMDPYQGQHLYQRPHFSQFPLAPSTPHMSQVAHGFPIPSMEQPQAFLHSMTAGFQPTVQASVFPGPVLGVPASSLNGHSFDLPPQRPPFVQDCGPLAEQFFQPSSVATMNLYHGPRMPQRLGPTLGMPQQLVHGHPPLTRQPPQSGHPRFQ